MRFGNATNKRLVAHKNFMRFGNATIILSGLLFPRLVSHTGLNNSLYFMYVKRTNEEILFNLKVKDGLHIKKTYPF